MSKKTKIVSGQSINEIDTIKSMYDQDSITLTDDKGKIYRLPVKELFKIINDLKFEVEQKKVHAYLSIITED